MYQERERTKNTRDVMSHTNHPDDLILNTGQMRDAVHLQQFRINYDPLDADFIIHTSAVREIDVRKAADTTELPTGEAGPSRRKRMAKATAVDRLALVHSNSTL